MKISLKVFLRFLKKENCFDAYITACKEDKKLHNNDCPMLEYLCDMGVIDNNKKCNENSIIESFDWDEFPINHEPGYTWWDISEKWKTFILQHEKNN